MTLSEPAGPDLPDFFMNTPSGALQAQGGTLFSNPDEAWARARSEGSLVVGMLPFDPEDDAALRVPREWTRSRTSTVPEAAVFPDGIPAPARPRSASGWDDPVYRQGVAEVLKAIHEKAVDKAVLSRILELRYDPSCPVDPRPVLASLLEQHPSAYVFSARPQDTEEYVMGASPELVVSVRDGRVTTHPLAGSAAREPGADNTADLQAGEALLASAKDRAEHAMVIEDLSARLAPLCTELDVPPAPSLLATPQLWHLGTLIRGELRDGVTALDVARAVHPTPAICGVPRDRAKDLILRTEPHRRGFFGGLVGWTDAAGNGEWALNLRSGAVSASRARLFAGAGLVEGSTPEGEHAETAVKLSTFLAALGLTRADLDRLAGR